MKIALPRSPVQKLSKRLKKKAGTVHGKLLLKAGFWMKAVRCKKCRVNLIQFVLKAGRLPREPVEAAMDSSIFPRDVACIIEQPAEGLSALLTREWLAAGQKKPDPLGMTWYNRV